MYKYALVAYIHSPELLARIEGIAHYHDLKTTEENGCFRLFLGNSNLKCGAMVERFNQELAEEEFEVEDSLSLLYPKHNGNSLPSFGTLVIKRKGNKKLRHQVIMK